ncbi:MAG: hypothetical protein WAL29_00835 [Bacteroidales bacterium]
MKRFFIFLFVIISFNGITNSQSILNPNYALKSHETLEINKIETDARSTVFYMTIENRITGGSFCADKNLFIVYPDGKRSKLVAAGGIPNCPAEYKFNEPGERLDFTLTFPPLKPGSEWIDLIEDCAANCFSFYGVNLDSTLNKRIDYAFSLAEKDDPAKALISFMNIAGEIDGNNSGIEGLLYINIIKLARESGDVARAEEWYKKFKLSEAPRLSQYIRYLNDQGIKY